MRPNDCVFFMGDKSCLKGLQCVECEGIYCTVYDPVEEEGDRNETWRYIQQGEPNISF